MHLLFLFFRFLFCSESSKVSQRVSFVNQWIKYGFLILFLLLSLFFAHNGNYFSATLLLYWFCTTRSYRELLRIHWNLDTSYQTYFAGYFLANSTTCRCIFAHCHKMASFLQEKKRVKKLAVGAVFWPVANVPNGFSHSSLALYN